MRRIVWTFAVVAGLLAVRLVLLACGSCKGQFKCSMRIRNTDSSNPLQSYAVVSSGSSAPRFFFLVAAKSHFPGADQGLQRSQATLSGYSRRRANSLTEPRVR
jgi:hypothetical protein